MLKELLIIASRVPWEKMLVRLSLPEPPKLNPGSATTEPWQMTREEWLRFSEAETKRAGFTWDAGSVKHQGLQHQRQVESANKAGLPVPPEVLKDYPGLTMPIEEIVRKERQGGSCIVCLENKHLPKAKDALLDALNIYNRHKQFTDIAEAKIQDAVFWLAGAESDLEKAHVSPAIKPAVDELRTEVGRLRHFMRVDESGLELATVSPKNPEAMKTDLERAIARIDELIGFTYRIVKAQVKEREAVLASQESPALVLASQVENTPALPAESVAGQTA